MEVPPLEDLLGFSKSRMAPSLAPFPDGALVGSFAEWLDLIGPSTEASPVFLWTALLAGISALLGRDATLAWGPDMMAPVIMTVLVGETCVARKSSAIADVRDQVVIPLVPKGSCSEEPPLVEVVSGLGSGEGFLSALADRRWKDTDGQVHVQQRRRVLFSIDEFGCLLGKQKRDQAGALIDFLLGVFDARPAWHLRTRNRALTATGATAALIAAGTPQSLAAGLTDADIRQGLPNRLLWMRGARNSPLAMRPAVDAARLIGFRATLAARLDYVRGARFALSESGRRRHVLHYEERYHRSPENELIAAATQRADIKALRVAMLLAAAEGLDLMSEGHIEAAWQVVEHSDSVVSSIVEQMGEADQREAEDRVLSAIQRLVAETGNTFMRRDVYQRLKGRRGMDAGAVGRVLENLQRVGLLVAEGSALTLVRTRSGDRPPDGGGGKRGCSP